jgi:hypothetical protein
VFLSSMEPLARNFGNVQTVVFPGIGHLPYEECAEEFNRALIEFLVQPESKSNPTASSGQAFSQKTREMRHPRTNNSES